MWDFNAGESPWCHVFAWLSPLHWIPFLLTALSAWQTDISFFFPKFFFMCTTFKVLIKFVTILFLFYVLVFFTKMRLGYRLPRWPNGKESACNAGDLCFIYELGRSPGGENGNPLQYSCLENPIDLEGPGGLQSMGLKKSHTWLSMHAYGILASWPGIEPAPPALEVEILTTGLPRKSHYFKTLFTHHI